MTAISQVPTRRKKLEGRLHPLFVSSCLNQSWLVAECCDANMAVVSVNDLTCVVGIRCRLFAFIQSMRREEKCEEKKNLFKQKNIICFNNVCQKMKYQ